MRLHRAFSLACTLLFLAAVASAAQKTAAGPETFPTADAAAQALLAANEKNDAAALTKILGPGAADIVSSGDGVQDSRRRERFVARAKEGFKVIPDPADVRHYLIAVGPDEWPLPIPIVKTDSGFQFDPAEAKVEILARRVGRNELATIETLRMLVDAEREYAYSDVNQNGMRDYAQHFNSTPGKHDGLYWEAVPGQPESPLGAFYAKQADEGYELFKQDKPSPYHGYVFRILKAQGPDAPHGARNYVVRGEMIGGFGFVAYPTEYAVSGVKTFIVNYDGTVYEKDLGSNTKAIASTMTVYNPDRTWTKSPEEETSTQ
jgi:Protein of unknown function (DUF2950)